MDQQEDKKNILAVDEEKNIKLKKRSVVVFSALIVIVLLVGTYFYYQNYFNLDKTITENNTAINTASSYKKIAYVGFGKSGQPFWIAMGKFSEDAASTRKVIFMDLTPNDPSSDAQVAALTSAVDQRVDGIILGANLPSSLTNVLDRAKKANIPIVAIDTQVDSPAVVSFIATDNPVSADLVGDFIVNSTKGKGTLLILAGEKTHPNSIDRVNGVKAKAEKAGMSVIVQYADWQAEKAYKITNDELSKPNNNITAIFGCSDPMTISAEKVVEDKGLQGKVILVGFDGLQETFQEIQNGKISATLAQPIKEMAKDGVETIINYLNDKQVSKMDLIPGIIVNKTNVGYFLD